MSEMGSKQLTAAGIMVTEVHCVYPSTTVRDAIQLLTSKKISGAPVIDTSRRVVSVLSEGDCLKLAAVVGLDKTISAGLSHLPQGEKLITLKSTATFKEIYKVFVSNRLHRVIIVDSAGRLQGIVSRSNILKLLISMGSPEKSEGAEGTAPSEAAPAETPAEAAPAENSETASRAS